MRCWKCGKENTDGVKECLFFHADQHRSNVTTEAGRALRQLYDHYGAEKVFSNPALMSNGLGDLITDSMTVNLKKLKNQLKTAMDAGIGRCYLEQLAVGQPDTAFEARVKMLLTEDADLSEKAAGELMGYFDEMIGWKTGSTTSGRKKSDPLNAGNDFGDEREKQPERSRSEEVKYAVGSSICFGRFEQDRAGVADAIEWIVLAVEDGRALLLSKCGLELMKNQPHLTWELSYMRKWLNEGFFKTAFTPEEKNRITEFCNVNFSNPEYGTKGGNLTKDKVFLLSIDEVAKYLPTTESRQINVTNYAGQKAINDNNIYETMFWWLRTPGSDSEKVVTVHSNGVINTEGTSVYVPSLVRPALWLKL